MHSFQPFSVDIMECNPFKKIGEEWMLVTSGDQHKVNTRTATWGGMGVMWEKNVAFVVLRASRYTKEFVDETHTFSLSFLAQKNKGMMKFLDAVSGRDEDKIDEAGLDIDYCDGVPYIDQANLVLICRSLSATELSPEGFIDDSIESDFYANQDYHTLYIAEITHFLAR